MHLLVPGIGITLLINGLTLFALYRAWLSPALVPHRIAQPNRSRLNDTDKWRLYVGDMLLSFAILFGGTALLQGWMFTDGDATALRVVGEAFATLFVYDAIYYAMHRWVFHQKKLMRYIHGLHHQARAPSALDSLLTHPVEVFLGLALLVSSPILIGGVHPFSFLLANFVHSELNLINHCGIAWPSGPMRIFNGWSRFHYGHHGVDMDKNFATLSPIWDWAFKTWV